MKSASLKVSLLLSAFVVLSSCSKKEDGRVQLWVYTSIYKEVLATYDEALKKDLPDIEVKWFQSGSENVASKILAELSAGQTKADLMMTSDLFFYQELKDKLLPLDPASVTALSSEMVDPDRRFAVMRFPVMVIAYNSTKLNGLPIPRSFKELLDPQYKGKIAMPSPLESGTALSTILYFSKLFSDDYFKGLRANDIISQGGNGATLSRIQSGEKPIGIVLMENVLQAREKGNTSVEFVIPEEGGLPMPSPLAIFASTAHPTHAQRLAAWMLGTTAQTLISKGWHYAALSNIPAPQGGPEWSTLKLQPWSLTGFETWGKEKQTIKDKFQETVLR
jgi:iron(III) transport system substrate-binding protein